MKSPESFTLTGRVSDYTIADLERLTDTARPYHVDLRAPTTQNRQAIVTNSDITRCVMTGLSCDVSEEPSINMYRGDYPLQAINTQATGKKELMLHEPVNRLESVKHEQEWRANMDQDNVQSWYAFNTFLNIVAAHALRRRPAAEVLSLADKFQRS